MLPELESNLDFPRSLLLSVRNEGIRIELVHLAIVHTLGKGSLRMSVAGFEVSWSVVACSTDDEVFGSGITGSSLLGT